MGLINQAIASLFNGVSQQPAQLRLSSQAELSENYYPTIATGLNKRPPTRFLAKLSSSTNTNAYVSVINRDTSEGYVLVIRDGSLEVFDAFTGISKAVTFPDGSSYLACSDPVKEISAVTVADHTFIVNRTKTVGIGPAVTPAPLNVGYVVFTYNGAGVGRGMTVTVNNPSTTLGSGNWSGSDNDAGPSITAIHAALVSSLGAEWSVTRPFDNIIRIERLSSDTDWTITASDTYGGSTMKVVKGAVQVFSDLPLQLDDGYVVYITSRPQDQGKGYYVRYSASSKSYIECPAPGTNTELDPLTLPHKLVRNADGTFTFKAMEWEPRKVGDYSSNPWPTFVGRKITDTFFWRNRLGFLVDESVVLSSAGDYFNFFAKTVTAVTDADPIDEAVANTKVSLLRFAVPFNKALLLFSDQTQFQLSAGDILSPRTVKADPVTEFVNSPVCRPVGAGNQLFFVSEKPNASGVREYYVDQDSMVNDAADVTAHVPSYIPRGAFKLSVSTAEDVLCLLTSQERNAMYVYKYYWGTEDKVQSAWCKFAFHEDDVILGSEFIGSVLYLVIARPDGIFLEEMHFQADVTEAGLPFDIHLDRKVPLTGTYDETTNKTTWTLPWAPSGEIKGVLSAFFGNRAASSFTLAHTGGSSVEAVGDFSEGPVIIGVTYPSRYRLSEQFIKDEKNGVLASAIIKIRRMMITYANTRYFRVEVTPPGRETFSYPFTGKVLGVAGVTLGSPAVMSGSFRVPVMSSSKGVRIDLVNDSPFPCSFQSAEWEGELVVQANRR